MEVKKRGKEAVGRGGGRAEGKEKRRRRGTVKNFKLENCHSTSNAYYTIQKDRPL